MHHIKYNDHLMCAQSGVLASSTEALARFNYLISVARAAMRAVWTNPNDPGQRKLSTSLLSTYPFGMMDVTPE
jgi:hypothetical protein